MVGNIGYQGKVEHTASFQSVFFFNKKFGWIVGSELNGIVSKEVILRTTDDGANWKLDSLVWLPSKIFFID